MISLIGLIKDLILIKTKIIVVIKASLKVVY